MRLRHTGLLAMLLGCAPTAVSGPSFVDAGADLPATDAPAADLPATDAPSPSDTPPPTDLPAPTDVPAPTDNPAPADVPNPTDVPAPQDIPIVDTPSPTDTPTAPTDVPATRCTTNAQCAGALPVCDRARGVCAQCTTAVPCAAGSACAGGRCVPTVACTSSRMCPGQVCDTAAGRCVDCVAGTDCPSGEQCRANLCVPPARMCRSSRECSELEQVCDTATSTCVDCAGDVDCANGFCAPDNTCRPRVCTPNARTCADATRVRVCDARGAGTTDTPCAANEVCSGGQCLSRVCVPGATDCGMDGSRRTCNADGLGYTTATCPSGQVCAGGQCLEGCPGGLVRCGSSCVDLRSDGTNCGACGQRCGAGEVCGAGREGCTAACVPATAAAAIPDSTLAARLPPGIATRPVTSGSGRAVVGEDTTNSIAFAIGRAGPTGAADLADVVTRMDTIITSGAPLRSILGGQRVRLADGDDATWGRLLVGCTSVSSVRDRVATSLAWPVTSAVVGVTAACVVEYVATRRASGDVIAAVAVAPRDAYLASEPLQRRLRDLTVFALPQATATPAAVCATIRATAPAPADVLWLQDTSASLTPYQARVGRGAPTFVNRLLATGVDARVAVIQAGFASQNLDSPGLSWVTPAQMSAAFALCDRLTSPSLAACPLSGTDTTGPYPTTGGSSTNEEPIAASITNFTALANRAAMGEVNPDRRLRSGARRFAIGLTDEPGSNDYNRYFQNGAAPDTMAPWGNPWSPATMANIAAWFTRNQVTPMGFYPHRTTRCGTDVYDLPRCVTSAAGGAFADLINATDEDTQATLAHFADTIAAEVSTLRLSGVPLAGAARVTVRGTEVPRSRTDGYDIDPVRRALVFYGTRYRPAAGDAVTVTYPAW